MQLGDYQQDSTSLAYKFTTRNTTGQPSALTWSTGIGIYKGGDTTPSTAGLTVTTTFDSIVGLNHIGLDLSAHAFYEVGQDYACILTSGTVNSVDISGETLFNFSIENRFSTEAAMDALGQYGPSTHTTTDVFDQAKNALSTNGLDHLVPYHATVTTSGTSVNFTDSGLARSVANHWLGNKVTFVSGTTENQLLTRIITASSTAGLVTFTPAANSAIASGDGFALQAAHDGVLDLDASGFVKVQGTINDLDTLDSNMDTQFATLPTTAELDTAFVAQLASTAHKDNISTALATYGVSTMTTDTVADAIWDETLTGSNHNDSNSAGKRLRQADVALVVHEGTAAAGSTNTITLDAAADGSNDDIYAGDRVMIEDGAAAGEHGLVKSYDSGTKVATMTQDWVVTPTSTMGFIMVPADVDVESWQHSPVVVTAGSTLPSVDVTSISGGSTEADDLQANVGNLDASVAAIPTTAELDTAFVAQLASTAHKDNISTALDSYGVSTHLPADVMTAAMTEAYTTAATPTPAQILFGMNAVLTNFSISSTVLTAFQIGSTSSTAATFELNSSTAPTALNRTG